MNLVLREATKRGITTPTQHNELIELQQEIQAPPAAPRLEPGDVEYLNSWLQFPPPVEVSVSKDGFVLERTDHRCQLYEARVLWQRENVEPECHSAYWDVWAGLDDHKTSEVNDALADAEAKRKK